MSMNFDGLRATQVLAELILQFSAFEFLLFGERKI
jgi:hypothetical protein